MSPQEDARRAERPRGRDGLGDGTGRHDDGAAVGTVAIRRVRRRSPSRRHGSRSAAAPLAFEACDKKAVVTVVYRCCKAFARGTDVLKKAADAADASWKAQVCGRALAEMLRHDASDYAWLAAVLSEHGSRAAVLGELRSYISAHGHEQWPVTKADEVELSFPLSVSLLKSDRDVSSALDGFKPATCPGGFGKVVSTTYKLAESAFEKGKSDISAAMPMPLWVTVNIKELQE
ncbi:hypothetical protein M885DRAFT_34874 [Pelagophyceae sp. CCMP2097]|nr:hypothetical protein M885DRAFT_34874 [Pelagophyceae sp. CCMP2097]